MTGERSRPDADATGRLWRGTGTPSPRIPRSPTRGQLPSHAAPSCRLPANSSGVCAVPCQVDPLRLEMGYHRLMFAALLAGGALCDHAQRRPGRPGPPQLQGGPAQGMRAYLFGSVFCCPVCTRLFNTPSLLSVWLCFWCPVCTRLFNTPSLSGMRRRVWLRRPLPLPRGLPRTPPTRASRAAARPRPPLTRPRAQGAQRPPSGSHPPPPPPPVLSGHAASPTPY